MPPVREHEPEASSSTAAPAAKQPRRSGKKGKVFAESTSTLLSIIDQVAGEKDAIRQDKLDRTAKAASVVENSAKTKASRKLDRTAPLRHTKKLLLEKEKEKKQRRKTTKKGPGPVPAGGKAGGSDDSAPKKKRVAFA